MDSKTCPGTAARPAHTLPATSEHFSGDKARPDGFCPYCKRCAADIQRQWKHDNPDKVREMKRKYRVQARQRQAERGYDE
jgi:hypothetical protein